MLLITGARGGRLGTEKKSINVAADQIGTPTYAADLAAAIVKILPQMNEQNRGVSRENK